MPPAEANITVKLSDLKTKPFFLKGNNHQYLFTDGVVQPQEEEKKAKREEILAIGIPALTFAVGHEGVRNFANDNNIDVQDKYLALRRIEWVVV
jgi:hypothetical protein